MCEEKNMHVHAIVHKQPDALLPERIANRLVQRATSKDLNNFISICLFIVRNGV